MEKFEGERRSPGTEILPLASVQLGVRHHDNIIDVPRNVTIFSRQQLSDIAITDRP